MERYLVAKEIWKSYGQAIALRGVSLELRQGEILALLGPNGCGKTTLIKVLTTLLTKDAGSVRVLGYDLDTQGGDIRRLIGYVGQDSDRSAYGRLTVRENLQFFGALQGLSRPRTEARILQLADHFDFGASLDRLFMNLSGGQKQTSTIMRALLSDGPLLFVDEPTKGLDPFVSQKIRRFLRRYIVEERKAALLTSHILSDLDELADRVALIHDGRIVLSGEPNDLKVGIGAQRILELPRAAVHPEFELALSRAGVRRMEQEESSEWIRMAVLTSSTGADHLFQLLAEYGVNGQYCLRPVSLADAYYRGIGRCGQDPTHLLEIQSVDSDASNNWQRPGPTAPAVIAATVLKDLTVARRYLPDLIGRLADLAARVGFFLLLSKVVTVSPTGSPLGRPLTGRDLFVFFQGALILLVFNSTALSTPVQSVSRDLYNGTLEYLYSLPSSRYAYFIGAILANAVLDLAIFLPAFSLLAIYSQSTPADILLLGMVSMLALTTTVALGVCIAMLALLWRQVGALTGVFSVLFEFLAGAYFPVEILPRFLKYAAMCLPYTWGYDLIRYYSFGRAWKTLLPVPMEWIILAAFGCAFTILSWIMLKKAERRAKKSGLHLI